MLGTAVAVFEKAGATLQIERARSIMTHAEAVLQERLGTG